FHRSAPPPRPTLFPYTTLFRSLEAEADEVQGVPTALNRQLISGELDIAPISSIEYARHADRLRMLPRLCVSSEGAVDSIQLVSRSEEHTSELQSLAYLVCRLLL